MRAYVICFAIGMLLAAGCTTQMSSREALARQSPELAKPGVAIYEVSLEFWEKVDQVGYENEVKFLEVLKSLGFVDTAEAQRIYSERLKSIREGHQKWSRIFPYIRAKTDPRHDKAFYYSSDSAEGILIVRNGRIRDKIVLSGSDAWRGD